MSKKEAAVALSCKKNLVVMCHLKHKMYNDAVQRMDGVVCERST